MISAMDIIEFEGFGAWLNRHRRSLGLTHEQLAQKLGVSRQTVGYLIHGVHGPNPAVLRKLGYRGAYVRFAAHPRRRQR